MLFSNLAGFMLAGLAAATTNSFSYERLSQNNSVLLIVDHQVGLINLARDFDGQLFYQNMIAHAALGKLFDIPVIITTSTEDGANGPIPKEIFEMYPDAPIIARPGEINAWDNPEFRDAVKATGRKQVIIAGIATEVCVAFAALSMREEGYGVWANVEASGTTSTLVRDAANLRMQAAGVQLGGIFSIVGELWRDHRNVPGGEKVIAWLQKYAPTYTVATQQFNAIKGSAAAE
ncbi:protein ycaC [Plectosphaerella plurivora]|uniref:Protein ycaC n=1 Tax=Plectosphaerella plurivora TaxID=936078 RepID=A0A9P8V5B6_9PEZI|nr:protein ycaC [Plectosphaerella plurivora]